MKVVRLLEPEICFDCRFAKVADVETEANGAQRMIYCTRLDCDNWDFQDAEVATSVQLAEE